MSRYLVLRYEITDSSVTDDELLDLADDIAVAHPAAGEKLRYMHADVETYD